jgi:hypothetical protein
LGETRESEAAAGKQFLVGDDERSVFLPSREICRSLMFLGLWFRLLMVRGGLGSYSLQTSAPIHQYRHHSHRQTNARFSHRQSGALLSLAQ